MKSDDEKLAARELGAYPLSVGTSLALEAAKEDKRAHYSHVYVNVYTLFRNLYSSLPVADSESILKRSWVNCLISEMRLFVRIAKEVMDDIDVVFYIPDYSKIHLELPKAGFRKNNTAKQLAYHGVSTEVVAAIAGLEKQLKLPPDPLELVFKLTSLPPRVLVMTNYAYDLLQVPWSAKLLESHTGKIKDRSQWHTKLAGSGDYSFIPFNRLTLTVFGDSTLIAPQPLVARRDLYAVAVECKWTAVTTYDYVKRSVDKMRDYGMRDLFRSMY